MKSPADVPQRSASKRYLDVERHLRRAIDSGKYAPGERLPDERQLAVMLGVSRGTVRVALQRLAAANRLERHQGRGTFVARPDSEPTYLCILAVGPTARQTLDVATTIAQADRVAHRRGLRLAVRYVDDATELTQAMRQIGADRANVGGLIVGHVAAASLAQGLVGSRIGWVMVGEFSDERRDAPHVDQVLPDWYAMLGAGTQQALEHGSRSPALAVLGQHGACSADCISAFRTACDAAHVARADQDIIDLHAFRRDTPASPEQYHDAVARAMLGAIDRWLAGRRLPDHLIMPATVLSTWFDCLHARSAARRLRQTPITAWVLEEQRTMLLPRVSSAPINWLLIPVIDQLEQAANRLFERDEDRPRRVRDYVRAFRIEPMQPAKDD